MARLPQNFFQQDTVRAAQQLLGRYLVRTYRGETLICRITETEAYIGAVDKACHAYAGRRTSRTETLYAEPGTAYVYLIYGMYNCLNVVTEPKDVAAAVLIRGCEPLVGIDTISRLRFGRNADSLTPYQRRNFMNGPGKLCKGLSIDRDLNNLPFGSSDLYFAADFPEFGLPERPADLPFHTGRRIGIDYAEEAADFPWRFWL